MQDRVTFNQNDLVLNINKHYDPEVLNLDEWEAYLEVLCGDRDYQKEAIKNSIIFLAGGRYKNTEDLVKENYDNNPILQTRYNNLQEYYNNLQIKNKLHANIDLATGTGKSFVIFGIAQIMLGLGLVKRALVLSPSITIEEGLHEKFTVLASSKKLKDAIPDSAKTKNVRIIDANQTILEGDICVENIHAVYQNTGSSITDSFLQGGEDTIVLNDESHHVYNNPQSISGNSSEGKNIKKWKEFLVDSINNFKYILGFTGTPYIENDYFNDVIYRYSLRQAIDDRVVKTINYVQEDDSSNLVYEKFQKIYQNHESNKRQNSNLKPLSVLITKDINAAKLLYEDLVSFIAEWEETSYEEAEEKALIITSHKDHKDNIAELKNVDNKDSSHEWIISVSMLTEGWDAKNVFQIVPWEDRAFNSKLLIAQVLGRGLRIPENYSGIHPVVTVFNHDSWSKNIKGLVDEVLEIETRVISSVKFDADRNKHNFSVYNLNYEKVEVEKEHDENGKQFNYSNIRENGIKLASQADIHTRETRYENVLDNSHEIKKYNIQYKMKHIDDVIGNIMHSFRTVDWESELLGLDKSDVYSKENLPPENKIKEIVRMSMNNAGITGDYLTVVNTQRVYSAFSTLFRKRSKTVSHSNKYSDPFLINTIDMNDESIGISSLRSGSSVYYSEDYFEVALNTQQKDIFKKFLDDETLPRRSGREVNPFNFKTPQNFVITNKTPEYQFVDKLTKSENATKINAWIKSRDKNFYSLEYTHRVGNHQFQNTFNPDFFIKCNRNELDYYLVVEIKSDGDVSTENKAKYKYGRKHFRELNKQLSELEINEKYIFHFLTPKDYDIFFEYIKDDRIFISETTFTSELEILLDSEEK